MDALANFSYGTVLTAPSPATTGTSLTLDSGQGARFPDPAVSGAYNIVVKAAGEVPISTNSTICRVTARSGDVLTIVRDQEGSSVRTVVVGDEVYLAVSKKFFDDMENSGTENFLKNGNFINNSTNGYGATPDDWTNSSANPVQGGFPEFTKQQLIDLLGIADGDIEGLWNLNESSGNAADLSSNGYTLTDNNTVGASSDGLMDRARDFVRANSEYLSNAAANIASLTGNQTWVAFIKPDDLSAYQKVMGRQASGGGDARGFDIQTTGQTYFYMAGLTTNASVLPEFLLEAGKWYMLVGIYDSSNSKLKYWVNGVKTEVTASGSATAITSDFALGRFGSRAADYFDGLIQNAMVLSVALTDTQVKKLWAASTYKGQKIRRSSTDALLYQDLDPVLVEKLRGKNLTLRASVYASSTNHRIYINDGTTTTAVSPTSADTWEGIDVTAAIPASATQIRIGIEADTSDGNMWVKEVALYEGNMARPFSPSADDMTRFPRLLKQDTPQIKKMSPYQYEEGKWYTLSLGYLGFSASPTGTHEGMFMGKTAYCRVYLSGYGTSNGTSFQMELPISSKSSGAQTPKGVFAARNNSANYDSPPVGDLAANSTLLTLWRLNSAQTWTNSGGKGAYMNFEYEID